MNDERVEYYVCGCTPVCRCGEVAEAWDTCADTANEIIDELRMELRQARERVAELE